MMLITQVLPVVSGTGVCTAGHPWDDQTDLCALRVLREVGRQIAVTRKRHRQADATFLGRGILPKQLLIDDDIHRVGDSGLVLRPVGRGGRAWAWTDPDFAGGPSDCEHAVLFASSGLARRFYEEWMG